LSGDYRVAVHGAERHMCQLVACVAGMNYTNDIDDIFLKYTHDIEIKV